MDKQNTQNMLSAIIIDDEHHARENLKLLIAEFCPEINVLALADGVVSGIEQITRHKPDVVFLDIRMPSGSEGFDLLAQLEEKNFQVVFVTAFKDYAIRALNAKALHYILKPIDIDDLRVATEKLLDYQKAFQEDSSNKSTYKESLDNLKTEILKLSTDRKITLFHARGFKIVKEKEIMCLLADNNCTKLMFSDGSSYLDSKTIKVFEEMLSAEDFLRIHKSHIINLNFLKEYHNQQGNIAELEDGTQLAVSRARLNTLLERVRKL